MCWQGIELEMIIYPFSTMSNSSGRIELNLWKWFWIMLARSSSSALFNICKFSWNIKIPLTTRQKCTLTNHIVDCMGCFLDPQSRNFGLAIATRNSDSDSLSFWRGKNSIHWVPTPFTLAGSMITVASKHKHHKREIIEHFNFLN